MPRRRHSRAVSRRKDNIWTTVSLPGTIIAATIQLDANIVEPSDWERQSSGKEGATLMGIRGYLSVTNRTATGALGSGNVLAYIAKFDKDVASPSPAVAATYAEEDILWTGGTRVPFSEAASQWPGWDVEFNVKSMRRITNGEDIRLIVLNQLAVAIQIASVVRGLVRVGQG